MPEPVLKMYDQDGSGRDAFVRRYMAHSGIPDSARTEYGFEYYGVKRYAAHCVCGESDCCGWAMEYEPETDEQRIQYAAKMIYETMYSSEMIAGDMPSFLVAEAEDYGGYERAVTVAETLLSDLSLWPQK